MRSNLSPTRFAANRLWPWAIGSMAAHGLLFASLLEIGAPAPPSSGVPLSVVMVEAAAPVKADRTEVHPSPAQPPSETRPLSEAKPKGPEPSPAPTLEPTPQQNAHPRAQTTVASASTIAPDIDPVADVSKQHDTPEPAQSVMTTAPTRVAMAREGEGSLDTTSSASAKPNRERLHELQRLLHRAIERRKHYPLSARRMGREGNTRVAFQLNPDGRLEAINIAQSSGYPPLDRAAVVAIQNIQPFMPASRYLENATPFEVDVVFRLYTP